MELSPEVRMANAGVTTEPAGAQEDEAAARGRPTEGKRRGAERKRAGVLRLADCAELPPRPYIVKGMLAPGDVALLIGPPSSAKSVLAPYMGHCVASGRVLFGRRVRRGPVLYVSPEDPEGIKRRGAALLRVYGDAPLFFLAEPMHLLCEDPDKNPDVAWIIAEAEKIGAVLIVIDTFAAAFSGLDENDGRSMSSAVRVLRALSSDKRAVIAVHHPPHNGEKPRGHSVLNGDADVTLRLEADAAGLRTITFGKNRHGPSTVKHSFTIRSEHVGIDDDGDPMTAPVAEEIEGTSPPKLADGPAKALSYLADVIGRQGDKLPVGPMFPLQADLRCVALDAWRDECRGRTLSGSGEKDAEKRAFQRAVKALTASKNVATGEHAGKVFVWIAKADGTRGT